jgi:hypothetical protein
LAEQGDTLEMMRAVLDSNFWLSTHVVTITIGYASTFISGLIGAIYLVRRIWDKGWNSYQAASMEKMDLLVNELIELEVVLEISPFVKLAHLCVQGGNSGYFLIRGSQTRELPAQGLEHCHDLEQVLGIGSRNGRDHRTSVGQKLDEPLGGKHLECLAQRGSRNAEALREHSLIEPRPRRQLAARDQLSEPARDFIM